MKISVFGSWVSAYTSEWKSKGLQDQFEQACFEIGAEIARRGHSIIISGWSLETADYHVVQGVLSIIRSSPITYPVIEVYSSSSRETFPFQSELDSIPHAFSFPNSSAAKYWQNASMLQIRDSDCVLVICGGKGSYNAGIAALMSGRRMVPVGSFGGAALELLDVFDSIKSSEVKSLISSTQRNALRGPWNPKQLETTICGLGLCDFPLFAIIHGRSKHWVEVRSYLQNELSLPEPIVMGEYFGKGQTLPEKWEQLGWRIHGAIAIATPDDLGAAKLKSDGTFMEVSSRVFLDRARQNVWVEVGWVWGRLGRSNVCVLTQGLIELPSDLQGLETYGYDDSPLEEAVKIQRFVESIRIARHLV